MGRPKGTVNSAKKRTNKRKALRLKNEAKRLRLAKRARAKQGDVNLRSLALDDKVIIGVRRGLIGHQRGVVLSVSHEDIVGGIENPSEFGGVCTKLGLLTLAALLGVSVAEGPDFLAKELARFAQIDLDALKKELADEAASETADDTAPAAEGVPAAGAGDAGGGGDPVDDRPPLSEAEAEMIAAYDSAPEAP